MGLSRPHVTTSSNVAGTTKGPDKRMSNQKAYLETQSGVACAYATLLHDEAEKEECRESPGHDRCPYHNAHPLYAIWRQGRGRGSRNSNRPACGVQTRAKVRRRHGSAASLLILRGKVHLLDLTDQAIKLSLARSRPRFYKSTWLNGTYATQSSEMPRLLMLVCPEDSVNEWSTAPDSTACLLNSTSEQLAQSVHILILLASLCGHRPLIMYAWSKALSIVARVEAAS